MDALKLLRTQHRQVERLFSDIEDEEDTRRQDELFIELADALALHTMIEERHFYPAVHTSSTEDRLYEALEEHLSVKRVLADMMRISAADPSFEGRLKVLKEEVEHHVKEEENELFPDVRRLLDRDGLEAIGEEMQETIDQLEGSEPRMLVPRQIEEITELDQPSGDGPQNPQ
jgi:hypothetical protein